MLDTKENAKLLSKSVITSSLTKAAVFGHDANWGEFFARWVTLVRNLILKILVIF